MTPAKIPLDNYRTRFIPGGHVVAGSFHLGMVRSPPSRSLRALEKLATVSLEPNSSMQLSCERRTTAYVLRRLSSENPATGTRYSSKESCRRSQSPPGLVSTVLYTACFCSSPIPRSVDTFWYGLTFFPKKKKPYSRVGYLIGMIFIIPSVFSKTLSFFFNESMGLPQLELKTWTYDITSAGFQRRLNNFQLRQSGEKAQRVWVCSAGNRILAIRCRAQLIAD